MLLFGSRRKEHAAHQYLVSMLNRLWVEGQQHVDGPRIEDRVSFTLPVAVVPLERGRPQFEARINCLTKDLGAAGFAIVPSGPFPWDSALVGFSESGAMHWLKATVRHRVVLGGGFTQVGMHVSELADPDDYSGLNEITLDE